MGADELEVERNAPGDLIARKLQQVAGCDKEAICLRKGVSFVDALRRTVFTQSEDCIAEAALNKEQRVELTDQVVFMFSKGNAMKCFLFLHVNCDVIVVSED